MGNETSEGSPSVANSNFFRALNGEHTALQMINGITVLGVVSQRDDTFIWITKPVVAIFRQQQGRVDISWSEYMAPLLKRNRDTAFPIKEALVLYEAEPDRDLVDKYVELTSGIAIARAGVGRPG